MSAAFVMILFAVCLLLAIPISMALAIACILPSAFDASFTASATYIVRAMFNALNSFPMLAVPMFILSGILMAKGGISRRLFDLFSYLIGKRTAGLPCAVIVTCLFYGAISGSGPATTAAVGAMCVPFMISLGYDRKWSAGLVAVAGGLGVIIPPSIPFVLYSLATGVSTGDLFLGGIIPGILIGVLMMIYAVIYCKRKGEDKALIREKMDELKSKGFRLEF
jgi:C4-dicarboxylate transporter DctM subunit